MAKPQPMEPFERLPWFALANIIIYLGDLPELYQLYCASPCVFRFLHHFGGVFRQVIDFMILYPHQEDKYSPVIRFGLRTCVYLWWAGNTSSEDNPLPRDFPSVFSPLCETFQDQTFFGYPWTTDYPGNLRLFCLNVNQLTLTGFGHIEFPGSIPTQYLGRLLAFSSRLENTVFACLLEWTSRIPEINRRSMFYSSGPNPSKIHLPQQNSKVVLGSPTWSEYQCVTAAVLACDLALELLRAQKVNILTFDSIEGISEMELKQVFQVRLSSHVSNRSRIWDTTSFLILGQKISEIISKDTFQWLSDCALLTRRHFSITARQSVFHISKGKGEEVPSDPVQILLQGPYTVCSPNIKEMYRGDNRLGIRSIERQFLPYCKAEMEFFFRRLVQSTGDEDSAEDQKSMPPSNNQCSKEYPLPDDIKQSLRRWITL